MAIRHIADTSSADKEPLVGKKESVAEVVGDRARKLYNAFCFT